MCVCMPTQCVLVNALGIWRGVVLGGVIEETGIRLSKPGPGKWHALLPLVNIDRGCGVVLYSGYMYTPELLLGLIC
jgi:hypothetical protein